MRAISEGMEQRMLEKEASFKSTCPNAEKNGCLDTNNIEVGKFLIDVELGCSMIAGLNNCRLGAADNLAIDAEIGHMIESLDQE